MSDKRDEECAQDTSDARVARIHARRAKREDFNERPRAVSATDH